MTSTRTKGIAKLGIASQCVLVILGFWMWLQLSQSSAGLWSLDLARYILYNTIFLLGVVFAYATSTDPAWFAQLAFFVCHRHAFRQTAFSVGLLMLLLVGERDEIISRVFLFGFVPILYVLLATSHRLLPPVLQKLSFGNLYMRRLLLAGSCQNVSTLEGWLTSKVCLGYSVMGLVCHDRAEGMFRGLKILGTVEDLERVIVEQDITHVILVEFPVFRHFLAHYTQICERHGVRLQVICDFERALGHPVTMFEDEGLRFIGLREEPLEDPFGRFAKRCLDIAVALPVVLFILPFTTLLVAWLQRRCAPGPIFYRQLRSGLQNVPFVIFKYRTMYGANPDPARQATAGDCRIYPAGRWLRKCSIDELPQFVNVLLGDMSVVGPRPHLLQHDAQFAQALANYSVRGTVKPGITGLAQVRGHRGETKTATDVVKRVESDIQYLENWSFWMDCWIILRTASQVVFPPRTAL
jgi:exopolysaccharide biosynthesis polyprenyl glycosylphosphotransferase